ncbi:MOSC domain-containing protein [Amphritea balenae]|uniref:MOSC domain-containing protein n=1 Tax=Amphritea balenae TaxID=452629 RepID=A0A3P1SUF0_9GAMM|nr:MOSC domain-containing protein [Amphritea balenae]RRD00575.1 MOSC domain-containing protein [Amphritea balenae]GGK69636.1 molybdenum cofactor sulfurase [Amphritea balenae]
MTQKQLFSRYLSDLKPGVLEWIGLRPGRKLEMVPVKSVEALQGLGLEGDHRCSKAPGSARQVTIISAEFIRLIEIYAGHDSIDPGLLRRNLVVSGINLNALRHQQFRIGGAVFEATALCHPCSRMDQALGPGGAAAMLGYGGLCARVVGSGVIKIGDRLVPVY